MFNYADNQLQLNGISLRPLVEEHGTPLYVYDTGWLKRRFQLMRGALNDRVSIHYAVKANTHAQVLRTLQQEGSCVDVVSGGEMAHCLENGFEGSQVIFSGVAKTIKEIRFALENQVGQLNVESFAELKRIAEIAQDMGVQAPVALRINPDVNPETHPYITTGFRENKFGIDTDEILSIAEFIKETSSLDFVGLSMHIGSQLLELNSMREGVERICREVRSLKEIGLESRRLDLGGGLGIFYDKDDEPSEHAMLKDYAEIINAAVDDMKIDVQIEPGRWLVGHCGVLLTEVQYIKETRFKKFVIVDTGMHHLLRPALYQAHHEIYALDKTRGEDSQYDIVGPICESSDVLGRDRLLPKVQSGDYLAVADTGAYGACLASRYNLHDLPKEVVIES